MTGLFWIVQEGKRPYPSRVRPYLVHAYWVNGRNQYGNRYRFGEIKRANGRRKRYDLMASSH